MANEEIVLTFELDRLAFGPLRRELVPVYLQWINDLSTIRFLQMTPFTLEQEYAWHDARAHDERTVALTIYEKPDLRPIGTMGLHAIDHRNAKAELGIMIGEPHARGRGLGTEAVRGMCDYGFNVLELHSIMLVTFGWNIAGQRAYKKAGFREIGRRRQARFFAGRYWDDVYYDLLREEFTSPALEDVMRDGIADPS